MPCPLNRAYRNLCGDELLNKDFERVLYDKLKPSLMDNACVLDDHSRTSSVAVQHPIMSIRDGYGFIGRHGQHVDQDSMLRNGTLLTQTGRKIILKNPGFLTIPYMGHGRHNPCVKQVRLEEELQQNQKSCLPYTQRTPFMPLIGCISEEIQDPVHIIQEDNRDDWVRGGIPSRKACRTTRNRCYDQKFNFEK